MQCPSGCYAGLSYYLQFLLIPHGSYCVLHATSFITSFVPLHCTTFAANTFASRLGIPLPDTKQHTWECTSLSQANATILTGFHSASLRHSFTSVAFSPPAAHIFCSPAFPISAAFAKCCPDHNTWHMAHSSLISPCSTKLTCIVPPPPYPDGKYTSAAPHGAGIAIRSSWLYCQPLMGTRRQFRSFLSPLPSGGSPLCYSADKCAAQLCFFFAAGAFTGRLYTFANASKKAILN
jgi:hypothetical protein